MTNAASVTVILSGAGGGVINPMLFCSSAEDAPAYPTIRYPGWPSYVKKEFSAAKLVEDLSAKVAERVPEGPIRIIGMSIGGHLGYAVALNLKAKGREIGGLCAIDTFTATSASPMAGWKGRALKTGAALLRGRRFSDFGQFFRSRLWRASMRLSGRRLGDLVNILAPSGRLPWFLAIDPILEEELSMRLFAREVVPWVATLDRDPIPLQAPSILIRTESTDDADAVWRRRCPQIKIVQIPGDHYSILGREASSSLREAFLAASSDWS